MKLINQKLINLEKKKKKMIIILLLIFLIILILLIQKKKKEILSFFYNLNFEKTKPFLPILIFLIFVFVFFFFDQKSIDLKKKEKILPTQYRNGLIFLILNDYENLKNIENLEKNLINVNGGNQKNLELKLNSLKKKQNLKFYSKIELENLTNSELIQIIEQFTFYNLEASKLSFEFFDNLKFEKFKKGEKQVKLLTKEEELELDQKIELLKLELDFENFKK